METPVSVRSDLALARAAAKTREIGRAQAHVEMRLAARRRRAPPPRHGDRARRASRRPSAARRGAPRADRRRAARRAARAARRSPRPSPPRPAPRRDCAAPGCCSAARCSGASRSILLSASIEAVLDRLAEAEIGEHGVHVVALRLGVGMMDVAHMDDEVGLGHFLERGAERGDEMGRQIGDEADRVGQDRAVGPTAARAAAWSDRASRRAGPAATTSARVRRLNSVDLPALV